MFDTFKNRLEITGTLTTITALRISAGRSSEPIGSDLPVIKDAISNPFIPGSSLKGALRSRLESFLRGIIGDNCKLVSNPAIETEWSITAEDMRSMKEANSDDANLTKKIIDQTDLISQLFGSPWLASKIQIRDLPVKSDTWFGQYQERDGVAIDRDTETAADGKLYDYQVVPAGTAFALKAIVENAQPWELGLLMVGLHQLESEQIPLGGGKSRGLGVVRLEVDQMLWFDSEDDPQKLLEYLKKIALNETPDYQDGKSLKKDWTEALIGKLRGNLPQPQNTSLK